MPVRYLLRSPLDRLPAQVREIHTIAQDDKTFTAIINGPGGVVMPYTYQLSEVLALFDTRRAALAFQLDRETAEVTNLQRKLAEAREVVSQLRYALQQEPR